MTHQVLDLLEPLPQHALDVDMGIHDHPGVSKDFGVEEARALTTEEPFIAAQQGGEGAEGVDCVLVDV